MILRNAIFFLGAIASAQPRLEFDVASIKPTPPETRGGQFAAQPGGALRVRNNPFLNLLVNAYAISNYQIFGVPAWIESEHYDIDAKAEGNPNRDQMMQMLQSLLAARFQLKVHRETREMPVFLLSAAKGGIRLEPWKEGSCVEHEPGLPPPARPPGQAQLKPCGNNVVFPRGDNMSWDGTKTDMEALTRTLAALMRRKVIDQTGFTAKFDFHLEWSRDDAAGPTVDVVLAQQLGLKLESGKGPVEVLVIDHVERPSGN